MAGVAPTPPTPQDIVQNIILRIREEVLNAGAVAQSIRTIQQAAGRGGSAIQNMQNSVTATSGAFRLFHTAGRAVGGTLTRLAGPAGAVVGAFSGIAIGAKKVADTISEVGRSFIDFRVAIGGGADAALKLQAAYAGVEKSSDRMILSVTGAAGAISKLAGISFTMFKQMGDQSGQAFAASLTNAVMRGMAVNEEQAGAFANQMLASLSTAGPAAIKAITDTWLAAGNDIKKQKEAISLIALYDPKAAAMLASSIQPGQDAASKFLKVWNEIQATFKKVLTNLKVAFAEVFGASFEQLLNDFQNSVSTGILSLENLKKAMLVLKVVGTNVWIGMLKAVAMFHQYVGQYVNKGLIMLMGIAGDLIKIVNKDWGEGIKKAASYWEKTNDAAGETAKAIRAMDFTSYSKESQKAAEYAERNKQAADKTVPPLIQIMTQLKLAAAQAEAFEKNMQGLSSAADTVADIMASINTDFRILNQSGSDFFSDQLAQMRELAPELKKQGESMLEYANRAIQELMSAPIPKDAEGMKARADMLADLQKQRAQALGFIKESQLATVQTILAGLKPLESQLNLYKTITSQVEKLKGIAQATFGTPGLSVQYIMMSNQALEMQKKKLGEMAAYIEQQYAIEIQAAKVSGDQAKAQGLIMQLEQKRAEINDEMLGVQQKQMENLKQLKDGYLDAVQAQAFGAGRFSKIIIDRQKSVAKAVETGMARVNTMLGVAGQQALKGGNIQPLKFMPQFGSMNMSQQQIQQQQQQLVNIQTDPLTKAAAQSATNVMNMGREALEAGGDVKKFGDIISQFNQNFTPIANKMAQQSAGMGAGGGHPDLVNALMGGAVPGRTGAPGRSGAFGWGTGGAGAGGPPVPVTIVGGGGGGGGPAGAHPFVPPGYSMPQTPDMPVAVSAIENLAQTAKETAGKMPQIPGGTAGKIGLGVSALVGAQTALMITKAVAKGIFKGLTFPLRHPIKTLSTAMRIGGGAIRLGVRATGGILHGARVGGGAALEFAKKYGPRAGADIYKFLGQPGKGMWTGMRNAGQMVGNVLGRGGGAVWNLTKTVGQGLGEAFGGPARALGGPARALGGWARSGGQAVSNLRNLITPTTVTGKVLGAAGGAVAGDWLGGKAAQAMGMERYGLGDAWTRAAGAAGGTGLMGGGPAGAAIAFGGSMVKTGVQSAIATKDAAKAAYQAQADASAGWAKFAEEAKRREAVATTELEKLIARRNQLTAEKGQFQKQAGWSTRWFGIGDWDYNEKDKARMAEIDKERATITPRIVELRAQQEAERQKVQSTLPKTPTVPAVISPAPIPTPTPTPQPQAPKVETPTSEAPKSTQTVKTMSSSKYSSLMQNAAMIFANQLSQIGAEIDSELAGESRRGSANMTNVNGSLSAMQP